MTACETCDCYGIEAPATTAVERLEGDERVPDTSLPVCEECADVARHYPLQQGRGPGQPPLSRTSPTVAVCVRMPETLRAWLREQPGKNDADRARRVLVAAQAATLCPASNPPP